MTEDRYLRQKDIVPVDKLKDLTVTVIGVGAIGRQVALQLTAIGVNNMVLIDPDIVEITNLASQGYWEENLGDTKVHSTLRACRLVNSKIVIKEVPMPCQNDAVKIEGDIIFCCVDDITVRGQIWESLSPSELRFFCDGRMAAESLRVLTAYDKKSAAYYATTLFKSEQAYDGPCTAKTTFYAANVIAGFMVAQFAKSLRDIPIDYDVSINLLSNEINVINN